MKSAYISLIIKKADMDSLDPKSYRPISNLSVLSMLLERLVSEQLVKITAFSQIGSPLTEDSFHGDCHAQSTF